jgi:DNA polymerase-3 subunit epsilon
MNNLLFFDFETTGVDPYSDRIVEMFFHVPEGVTVHKLINPDRPIPAEASAIHGITDEKVKNAPTFRQFANATQKLVEGRVLVGYNCRRFDTVLLDEELRRAGQPGLLRENGRIVHPEIDLYQIWSKHEERTLASAARRFADIELGDDAHAAEADTMVLPKILNGMLDEFILDGLTVEELCAQCIPEGAVDRDGKFRRREDGVVVFNFGPKKDAPATSDTGLLGWMLGKDFSVETKEIARSLIKGVPV